MTDGPPPSFLADSAESVLPTTANAAESASPRVVRSDVLFAGGTQLAIRHDRAVYILRQTRSGKLILTK